MTHKISSHEFQRADTRADMVITTKIPRDVFDDIGTPIIPRLRGSGISAGAHIHVQIVSELGDEVYHEVEYVVVSARVQEKQVMIDDFRESTARETTYRLERRGEWWSSAAGKKLEEAKKAPKAKAA